MTISRYLFVPISLSYIRRQESIPAEILFVTGSSRSARAGGLAFRSSPPTQALIAQRNLAEAERGLE
jgi:hypothetical protein